MNFSNFLQNKRISSSHISCEIKVAYAYDLQKSDHFTIDITDDLIKDKTDDKVEINLNGIIARLSEIINLNNFSISVFYNELNAYIYYGINNKKENKDYFIDLNIIDSKCELNLKLRKIINKRDLLCCRIIEEPKDELILKKKFNYINIKSKRGKERNISEIIKSVYMWRKLFKGYMSENGDLIKMNLDEASDKIGISKKTLDDYYILLKNGKKYGFDFDEHKNEKVGILRNFIRIKIANNYIEDNSLDSLEDLNDTINEE